jgi:hypothetical protein
VTLRNIADQQSEAEGRIGRDLISRFQYYRTVRNWVVHTKNADVRKPQAQYAEILPYSEEHRKLFASLSAPNSPLELNFDDFIFFTRLTKLIAEKICRLSEPASEDWARLLSLTPFKRLQANPERMRNAVAGKLRTEYGMDEPTAKWIAYEICDSLA